MPKSRVKRHSVTQPSDQSYRLIPLTQGQNTLVDASDYDWLMQWNWCIYKTRRGKLYANRWKGTTRIWMHREILGCSIDKETDHQNGNSLDNRRFNLREASRPQNAKNRKPNKGHKLKGVRWHEEGNGWQARIHCNGKSKHLGLFKTEKEAAEAYDEAAKRLHGEFARLNFQ